jgi:hypothetical protein
VKRFVAYGILAAVSVGGLLVVSARTDPLPDAPPSSVPNVESSDAPRGARARPPRAMPTTGPSPVVIGATTGPTSAPTTAATTGPSTSPGAPATTTSTSTSPAGAPSKPFPQDYALLLSRSLFARGTPGPKGQQMPGGPEANLGLRGVLMLDGQFTALIEDIASKSAKQYKANEPVGPGKIKSITLDAIEYVNGGTTRQVSIGQNLLGMPLPPQPPPPPPQPPAGQPGQPGGPGQPGQPQPGQPGGPQPGRSVRVRG